MRKPMSDLDRFLEEAIASGKIPGVSLVVLRAGTISAEHYFGVRGAHDRAGVDAATVVSNWLNPEIHRLTTNGPPGQVAELPSSARLSTNIHS